MMLFESIKHIEFAYPFLLLLFFLLPLMIWRYVKKPGAGQAAMKVSSAYAFPRSSWKNRFRHLPFVLRLLSLSCLIIALARPQQRNDEQITQGEAVDIILCMDVSGSMGSRDILPSRLEAAKEVAIDFVRKRPVDRIGLVIFSGESFTQCPITTDKNTLISQIHSMESRRFLIDGTVIGEGLATAVDRLTESDASSKVIILLTDGKEDAPASRLIDPLTALEIAKAKNVKVYTIGMNAASVVSEESVISKKGVKSTAGNILDEELLRKIANETGGKYFRARDKEGLENIYEQIDKLEKIKIEIISLKAYKEEYLLFVLAALAFLLLEITLKMTILKKFP